METMQIIVAALVVVFLVVLGIWLMGFKNWLVYAVSLAEKELGSKTGELKLRKAYDLAVERYKILAKIMPFALFKKFVDSALKVMRKMIEENKSIKQVITEAIEEKNEEVSE